MKPVILSSADITIDRNHRYTLKRCWDDYADRNTVMFIGLNPSRADEKRDDATIIRCINFAQAWGFGSMYFANLYSYRTPYVKAPIPDDKKIEKVGPDAGKEWKPLMEKLNVAVGEYCNYYLDEMIGESKKVVCAWGSWPFIHQRATEVVKMIRDHGKEIHIFGQNKDGHPKHPLYLASASQTYAYMKKRDEGEIKNMVDHVSDML